MSPNPSGDMDEDESTSSEEDPHPTEDEKLENYMMAHYGNLFPEEFKKEGCSECWDVLKQLMKIEDIFKLLKREINERNGVQMDGAYKITRVYYAINWKWTMVMYVYSLLLRQLNPLEPETELRDAISKSTKETQETELRIKELLESCGIPCDVFCYYAEKFENLRHPIAVMANSGSYCYDDITFEKTAHGLIKEMGGMDEELNAAKNENAVDKMIGVLRSQFELAQQLPTPSQVEDEIRENLLPQVTVLRGRKFMYEECTEIVSRAHHDMEETCYDMLELASGIWEMRHKGDQGNKCGVKDTLDSLLEKANSFIEGWDNNYATYFREFDDATILKRQRL